MRSSLLDCLACPMGCGPTLSLIGPHHVESEVVSGKLVCGACSREWLVEEGIPRLLPSDLTVPSVAANEGPSSPPDSASAVARQRSEIAARDAQAGDYDRMWHLNLFGLVEVPLTLAKMELGSGQLLLEAGCGTGRMTRQFAARCRDMVAVDFSFESLRSCREKLRAAGITNVHLVQADLCHLPLRSELFDRVVSCQVLEHIPSPQMRSNAIQEMSRVVRSGGNLTVSAYQYSLLMRLFGEKEGEHAGGIYFYRFTRKELRELLEPWVRVESMTGALVYHYIAKCRK